MEHKIDPTLYETDKPTFASAFATYERLFQPLADKEIVLLELGVNQGGSLKIWRDFFRRGTILGLDISPVQLRDESGRIFVYQGMQQDAALLDRIAGERAPEGFDIIIDDCAHIAEFSALSFRHLFDRHLKPGGMYVIEDWGTGYWPRWPDGRRYRDRTAPTSLRSRLRPLVERLHARPGLRKWPVLFHLVHAAMNRLVRITFPSHQSGMPGFIKQLVDECAMGDITDAEWGAPPYRPSRIESMRILGGQVVVVKAG